VGTTAGGHLVTHPAASKKSSGSPKPTANGTAILPVPVASMEATLRSTSPGAPGEVSGPMSGTPAGTTTPSTQVDKAAPPGERRNKTPVYVSGVRGKKIPRLASREVGKLADQMKGEYLMLVPETADGFRTTISALRSLGEGEGVSFHTPCHSERTDACAYC
jgi:hypothetical protein